MRSPFDLNLATLERLSVVVQGVTNVGKTHLIGDMLKHEEQFGPIRFLDVKGEKGWTTISHMGWPKDISETIENATDVQDFAADCIRHKVHAVGLDGLRLLYNHVLVAQVQSNLKNAGQVRLPDANLDGDRSKTYWSNGRFLMEQAITALKTAVNVLVATSTSAVDVHEVTGNKSIAPDIYGKMGSGLTGLFDFAGYMTSAPLGPGRVAYNVSFEVRSDVQTRQRLAVPLTEPIILPSGLGGWALIKAAFQQGLRKGAK